MKRKDTWKDIVLFIAECLVFAAMFVYCIPANAEGFILTEDGQERELVSLGTYTLTAYDACLKCCGKTDGITASGVKAQAGHTIAAPKNVPFGTKLIIDGVEYTVEDRGGAIRNKRLDIYFNTHAEAKRFGKQRKEVFTYKK